MSKYFKVLLAVHLPVTVHRHLRLFCKIVIAFLSKNTPRAELLDISNKVNNVYYSITLVLF